MWRVFLSLLLPVLQWSEIEGASLNDVKQLSEILFGDYSTETRPVNDTDTALAISVTFNLVGVLDLNHQDQNLALNGLFQFAWTDESLTWNPSDHAGIEYIIVQQKRLWFPDMVLRNTMSATRLTGHPDASVSVTYRGRVNWDVMASFTSSCAVDVTFFPFDTQTCGISLTPFISTTNEITMLVVEDKIQLERFHENGYWRVTSTSASSGTVTNLPVSEVKYELMLERRASYHILTTIFPIIVLSLLTTTVFLVPADCGERLTLSVILFLCYIVFLLSFNGSIPMTTQHVAIVAIYVYVEMVLAAIAVILSVVIVRTHDKMDMGRVPRWLQSITRWFRNLFCWSKRKSPKFMFPQWRNHFIVNHWVNRKYHYPTSTEEEELDWVDVAEVLDRIFYLVFLFCTVLCAVICLSLMVHRW